MFFIINKSTAKLAANKNMYNSKKLVFYQADI